MLFPNNGGHFDKEHKTKVSYVKPTEIGFFLQSWIEDMEQICPRGAFFKPHMPIPSPHPTSGCLVPRLHSLYKLARKGRREGENRRSFVSLQETCLSRSPLFATESAKMVYG